MIMTRRMELALILAVAAWLAPGETLAATCLDELDALEADLEEAAELAISASTGGQGVAGAREAQAMEVVGEDETVEEPAVPFQEEEDEAEAVEQTEEAGEGGDVILEAQILVSEARSAAEEGNEAGCRQAFEEAAQLLDEYRLGTEAGVEGEAGQQ
jgi:hypothetical protein